MIPYTAYLLYLHSGFEFELTKNSGQAFYFFHNWLLNYETLQELRYYSLYNLDIDSQTRRAVKNDILKLNLLTNSSDIEAFIKGSSKSFFWENLRLLRSQEVEPRSWYTPLRVQQDQLSKFSGFASNLFRQSPKIIDKLVPKAELSLRDYTTFLSLLSSESLGYPSKSFQLLKGLGFYEYDAFETTFLNSYLLTKYHVSNLLIGLTPHKVKLLQLHNLAQLRFWCAVEQLALGSETIPFFQQEDLSINKTMGRKIYTPLRVKILELIFLYPTKEGAPFLNLYNSIFLTLLEEATWFPKETLGQGFGVAFDVATLAKGVAGYDPLEILEQSFVSQDIAPLPLFNKDIGLYNNAHFQSSTLYSVDPLARALPFHTLFTKRAFQYPNFRIFDAQVSYYRSGFLGPSPHPVESSYNHPFTFFSTKQTYRAYQARYNALINSSPYLAHFSSVLKTFSLNFLNNMDTSFRFLDETLNGFSGLKNDFSILADWTLKGSGSSRTTLHSPYSGSLLLNSYYESSFSKAVHHPDAHSDGLTSKLKLSGESNFLTRKFLETSLPSLSTDSNTLPGRRNVGSALFNNPLYYVTSSSFDFQVYDSFCSLLFDKSKGPIRKLPLEDLHSSFFLINRVNSSVSDQFQLYQSFLDGSITFPQLLAYKNPEYLDQNKLGVYNLAVSSSPETILGFAGPGISLREDLFLYLITLREPSPTPDVIIPLYYTTSFDKSFITTHKIASIYSYGRPLLVD